MKNTINKLKNKKVVGLLVSIIVVIIILMNSTYSLLLKEDETEDIAYTTGLLSITSSAINGSVTLTDSFPIYDNNGIVSTPYTFKITNTGNLIYKFDLKLLSTSTTNQINANYIKVSVNSGAALFLGSLTNGIIKEDLILAPGDSVDIELRVWLDINTPNTEIGKVFNGKITTEGEAIYGSSYTFEKLGLTVASGIPDFSKTSCSSGCDEATVGIYQTQDDLGLSYYYRGDVTNNYVKFGRNSSGADMYWRIIRINGDGTVRMIYDGTSAHANGTSSTNRRATTSKYNSSDTADNTNVGYMSSSTGASTYELTHANSTDSTIKGVVDNWYKTNIVDTGYSSYVADAIYCNDRSLYSGTGIGTVATNYMPKDRIVTKFQPTLICSQVNDRFTVGASVGGVVGNEKLTYPVGLIAIDEVSMAGGKNSVSNKTNYLYTGHAYWSMSPYSKNSTGTLNLYFNANGLITNNYTTTSAGVRPVISLKVGSLKLGGGTSTEPYIVWQIGDVDRDGSITKNDSDMILRYVVSSVDFDVEQMHLADVNADGIVNMDDTMAILNKLNGK